MARATYPECAACGTREQTCRRVMQADYSACFERTIGALTTRVYTRTVALLREAVAESRLVSRDSMLCGMASSYPRVAPTGIPGWGIGFGSISTSTVYSARWV